MSRKVERVLVQGTVVLEINCNFLMGLVDPKIAGNEYALKKWLLNQAVENIGLASADIEIDNVDTVNITKETSDQFVNEIITNSEWNEIKRESVNLEGKGE